MYRRMKRLPLLFGLVVLVLGASACGSDNGTSSSDSDAVKIAMLNSGSKTDSSWTQAWFQSTEKAQKALGDTAEVTYVDNLNSVDALDRAGGAALTKGAAAVIYATGEVPNSVTKFAEDFPDRVICEVTPPRETYPDNLCTIFPEFQYGAFLAGALAGLTTKSDHVGVVAAIDIPVQNLQAEGFILGARYVNPGVKVERVFTQSLIDPAKARAAADAQFSAGVDIILSAVDDGIRGVYAAAREHDGEVIAQYTDQYEDAPDVVLTSVLYQLDSVGAEMIELAAKDKIEGKAYIFGMEDDVGVLAPVRGAAVKRVDPAALDQVDEIESMMKKGEIKLPDVDVLGVANSADKIDPQSLKVGG